MPQYRNPFEKGDLFIKFDVQFPDNNWLSPEKLTVRQTVLKNIIEQGCPHFFVWGSTFQMRTSPSSTK